MSDPTVPGSYVVVLTGAPGTARAASAVARAQALGATIEHRYDNALNGFAARLTPDQLAAVRDDPDVAYVAPTCGPPWTRPPAPRSRRLPRYGGWTGWTSASCHWTTGTTTA
ncbi:protease inhibitor I9 family protein [Phytohabitans rumicis]|uniref:Inhibitor I9 domain-containing protein n=1 Tax=Phytohabitans rumicis TaxID=1076125 RepID=A0A6V8LRY6_9ACTN|nr:protease inhibitor I9 family protein [Phytohabitans rumicis]GFJ95515.1 hypothetical protein Prum_091570 [Phytohabitans rumicis]